MTELFLPLDEAGVSQGEFAQLVGVSRVAVWGWVRKNNPSRPHKLVAAQVQRVLDALRLAVLDGHLPINADSDQRMPRLKEIIEPYMRRFVAY